MRLIFAGTPAFAALSLQALLSAGHEIELVLTQPDRKSGRGKKLQPSAVKLLAVEHGLMLYQPPTLRDTAAQQRIAACNADAMVVAAYGLILPPGILQTPRLGCINVHASLLPRWRGAAPIQRAIEAGDQQTGITIMQMDAGLDTGPMLLVDTLPIGPHETGGELHDRLARLGGQALVQALAQLGAGTLSPTAQPEAGACYAARLTRADANLDWSLPAPALVNRVRAFDPVPGNACVLESDPAVRLKIWQLRAVPGHGGSPGVVEQADAATIQVACGNGAVQIAQLQRAGGRRMTAAEFQRGVPILTNERLTPPKTT